MHNVEPRLYLWRDGALHTRLRLPQGSPMVIDSESAAQVKMKLVCRFYHDGEIDLYRDRLAPALFMDGVEHPLGLYVFARCQRVADGGSVLWRATGLDLCQLARRHVPESLVYWAAGARYQLAVEQLLGAAGLTEYRVAASDLAFATAREDWPRGENALAICNALLAEMSYHSLFADLDGVVRAVPYRAPGEAAATVRYTAEDVGHILLPGHSQVLDGIDHPNVFYYTCENPELPAPLTVKRENTTAASPYSVQNQGRVPVFRKVDNVANEAALAAMAERELLESLSAARQITFYTGLCPRHTAFDVVQLEKADFFGTVHERYWKMTVEPGGLMEHRGRIVEGY